MSLKRPEETYVRNGAELSTLWQDLMGPGGFGRRSLWLIFLYADGQLSPLVMPIDDIPVEPDAEMLANLVSVIEGLADDAGFTSTALLLSRPGSAHITTSDTAWAREIMNAFGRRLSPWPVHLATRGTVRTFAPDDLIAGRSA
ncbi:MAG TPA: hypothetical protein VFT67_01620 [Jatrophihabitantaceae bacterium]|nr:hypothetical protein [Jatrophihabitantaceae bacterium]